MPRSLTPEQQRNRAILLVALRVVAAFFAVVTAYDLWEGVNAGYFKFGVSRNLGPSRDYVILDTPVERAIGSFALESIAITFGVLAVRPRMLLSTRFLIPSVVAMAIGSILIGVLYKLKG